MQDLSQVTGSKTIIKIAGQEVILEGVTLEDIGAIQGECLRLKRKAKLQVAYTLREVMTPEEYEREWNRAREESEKLSLTEDDFNVYMRSPEGAATIFWIIAERQYPGRFKRQQFLDAINRGDVLLDDAAIDLATSMEAIQQKGNE